MSFDRWMSNDKHCFDCFIPDVGGVESNDASHTSHDTPDTPSEPKRKRKRVTVKGAMYFKYNADVHQWITHLRRVHWQKPPITIDGKQVKASNPLAPVDEPLYYIHSKTAYYNHFFIEFWEMCMVPTFKNVAPLLEVESMTSLRVLFELRFKRYIIT